MNEVEEVVYINSTFAENMKSLGMGIIDKIQVYRREKDKVFFKAGKRGRFHLTEEELAEVSIPDPN